jgi:hypothetical protein
MEQKRKTWKANVYHKQALLAINLVIYEFLLDGLKLLMFETAVRDVLFNSGPICKA